MWGDRVFGSKSRYRVMTVFIGLSLQGCALPFLDPPQTWGLAELQSAFPPGASGRDLDKDLISRGFAISSDLIPPLHRASFMYSGGILLTCVASVNWDEDKSGKITSNLTIMSPCVSF